MKSDHAISETVSVILIIFMVLILAIVVAGLLFGANIFQQKSALIVSDIKNQTVNNKNVISVFHRAGDEVYINSSLTGLQEMGIYVDNRSYSWRAQPVLGLNTVQPGTTLFIYYNASKNIYRITSNAGTLSTNEAQSVVDCPLKVRLVDERARLLITSWNWTCTPPPLTGPAPTVTKRSPTSGIRGWPVTVTISGTNFLVGATAKLNLTTGIPTEIPASSCTVVNATNMACSFTPPSAASVPASQIYNIVVTNPDGKQGMGKNYFTVYSNVPTLSSSTPATGVQGTTVVITRLLGTNFQPGAVVVYSNGTTSMNLTSMTVVSSTNITGTLVIPIGATVGPYNVTVTNKDGRTVTRAATFTVTSNAPTATARSNATIYAGWTGYEFITGTKFVSGAISVLNTTAGDSIPSISCDVRDSTHMFCSYDLFGKPVSTAYRVAVINPDNKSGLMTNNLVSVSSPAPTITSSTPASGVRGTPVPITNLLGSNFQPGANVTYWRGVTSIPLDPLAVPLRTQITGSLDITTAPTGAYNITVLNPDGKTVTRTNAFTVYASPPPSITGIVPGTGVRGAGVPVVVTGTNIQAGARVRLYNGTTSVYLAPLGTVTPPDKISTTFTVPASVIPGTMNVRITNPDGQYAIRSGGYILT